jgi:hypothetical protein
LLGTPSSTSTATKPLTHLRRFYRRRVVVVVTCTVRYEAMDNVIKRLQELGVEDEQLLRDVNDAAVSLRRKDEQINHFSATPFCSIHQALFGSWQPYDENDYIRIVRDWDEFSRRIRTAVPDHYVVDVYHRTRSAALERNMMVASHSQTLLSNQDWAPVRLCSFPNSANFADKAHLCPKTAVARKCDTWIYAVAAVLGMPCDTAEARRSLIKAVCGSCVPGEQAQQWTGINRSPFNLLLFMEQGRWFDSEPSVMVAPVLSPTQARDWDGAAYEVLIICSDKSRNATAEEIAQRIGLTTTDRSLVARATANDVRDAVSLLSTVVKASAFCLEQKTAPPSQRGEKMWGEYQDSLIALRSITAGSSHNYDGHVYVPTAAALPTGKFVVKVNLAQMTTTGSRPAFPDPLLVAYKSSINWTRLHGFKLMAEAEPQDAPSRRRQIGRAVEDGEFSVPSEITV